MKWCNDQEPADSLKPNSQLRRRKINSNGHPQLSVTVWRPWTQIHSVGLPRYVELSELCGMVCSWLWVSYCQLYSSPLYQLVLHIFLLLCQDSRCQRSRPWRWIWAYFFHCFRPFVPVHCLLVESKYFREHCWHSPAKTPSCFNSEGWLLVPQVLTSSQGHGHLQVSSLFIVSICWSDVQERCLWTTRDQQFLWCFTNANRTSSLK